MKKEHITKEEFKIIVENSNKKIVPRVFNQISKKPTKKEIIQEKAMFLIDTQIASSRVLLNAMNTAWNLEVKDIKKELFNIIKYTDNLGVSYLYYEKSNILIEIQVIPNKEHIQVKANFIDKNDFFEKNKQMKGE